MIDCTSSNLLQDNIRKISYSDLAIEKDCIGKGAFGKCYSGQLAHLQVCVKVYRPGYEYSFPTEAQILSSCCHKNIPWLYGVVAEGSKPKMLVMSWHGINSKACTLYKLLKDQASPDTVFKLMPQHSSDIVNGIISAVYYIHCKCILHNDIKCDNIAIEFASNKIKSFLIDFGKACLLPNAKHYKLSC